jgi:hypothetical protein
MGLEAGVFHGMRFCLALAEPLVEAGGLYGNIRHR